MILGSMKDKRGGDGVSAKVNLFLFEYVSGLNPSFSLDWISCICICIWHFLALLLRLSCSHIVRVENELSHRLPRRYWSLAIVTSLYLLCIDLLFNYLLLLFRLKH